jgi:uncharacterized phiE125 gp8 family phage protein
MEELLNYSLTRTVAPASEPLTTAEAKTHLNIAASDTSHDSYVAALIQKAREQVEHDSGMALITQTWTHVSDDFEDYGDGIQLTRRPIQSITSIVYKDNAGTATTLPTSVYALDAARQRILLKYNQLWPTVRGDWDAVTITYVAGFGDNASSVPMLAKQCMLLLIGYDFENRDMLANETIYNRKAYEDLVIRLARSSYP